MSVKLSVVWRLDSDKDDADGHEITSDKDYDLEPDPDEDDDQVEMINEIIEGFEDEHGVKVFQGSGEDDVLEFTIANDGIDDSVMETYADALLEELEGALTDHVVGAEV